ncbi:MAG: hypothetical protein AAF414_21645 [Pseudomonadota bacterium]
MIRVRYGVIALTAAIGLASAADQDALAQDAVAHYVSVDDLRYLEDGVITPLHEYVEITTVPDGPDRIEVGYQHIGTSSYWMLTYISWSMDDLSQVDDAAIFGRLDPMNQRRIGLSGTASVADGYLTWEAEEHYAIDPLRTLPGEDPRPSPFLTEGTQATLDVGGRAISPDSDVITALGDGFILTANGREHSFQRVDPRRLPLANFLATVTDSSVAATRDCMADIADAYLAGQPYIFSDRAIAEVEARMGDSPGWPIVQERGAGIALKHFLGAALEAQTALNERLAAEIETFGLLALMQAWAHVPTEGLGEDWRIEQGATELVIQGLHILPGDPRFPDQPVSEALQALIDETVAAYEADPWSQTGPYISARVDGGWVSNVAFLILAECDAL